MGWVGTFLPACHRPCSGDRRRLQGLPPGTWKNRWTSLHLHRYLHFSPPPAFLMGRLPLGAVDYLEHPCFCGYLPFATVHAGCLPPAWNCWYCKHLEKGLPTTTTYLQLFLIPTVEGTWDTCSGVPPTHFTCLLHHTCLPACIPCILLPPGRPVHWSTL